jgi:hypothetical protein
VSVTKEVPFVGAVIACGVGVLIVSPASTIVGVETGKVTGLAETAGAVTAAVEMTVPVETAGWPPAAQPNAGAIDTTKAAMNHGLISEA